MKRLLVVGLVALAGCSLRPTYYQTLKEQATALRQGDLESAGIAFITPSTVTGQEQEKQVVALAFADVLKHQRPGLKVSSLAETLSAVNRAGLTEPYKRMYDDYRDTGLFSSDTLRRVAEATGTRYVAQLKLQGFGQGSKGRFGLLGLRIVETLYGDVRVYLQIWDSRDGSIAWEGMHELRISRDTTTEEPITMRVLLERSAQELVAKLP
ncbi:MAG: hypothetical protein E6H57_02785 [Betaproteobacteria bacterium]|nr:MAG: hypothetical protein E6H57_02785 [Betaproteobacteria bacterium]